MADYDSMHTICVAYYHVKGLISLSEWDVANWECERETGLGNVHQCCHTEGEGSKWRMLPRSELDNLWVGGICFRKSRARELLVHFRSSEKP